MANSDNGHQVSDTVVLESEARSTHRAKKPARKRAAVRKRKPATKKAAAGGGARGTR